MANAPVELVERVPLFTGLDKRELKTLTASLRDRVFPAGTVVVQEGESGVGFFVIESGSARVSVAGQEVRRLGPGDHFGEIALIADTARTATITAESEVTCYGMTVWDFRAIVEQNASIAWKLLQNLARQLSEAEHRHG